MRNYYADWCMNQDNDSAPVDPRDFPAFSSAALAGICSRWPGTNAAREARAELISRRALAYGEWCRKPWECVAKGYCPLDPNCGD